MSIFYDCDEDQDVLEHVTPEDAIADYFYSNHEDGETVEQKLDRLCPVTVYSFENNVIDDKYIERSVERMVDGFDESFGNPECDLKVISDECKADIMKSVKKACTKAAVWSCSKVGELVFTREECREIAEE